MEKSQIEKIENSLESLGNSRRFFNLVIERGLKVKKSFASEDLQKRTVYSGRCLLADYETDVNRAREREGKSTDFQAHECSGRIHVSKYLLTDTKTHSKYYLAMRVLNMQVKSTYLHNGENVELSEIQDMLLASEYKRYESNSRQGVDKPIKHITPMLDNIRIFEIEGNKII
jgi:hypothetical protein